MGGHVQDEATSNAVRNEVAKILESGEFSGSEVLRKLLSFIASHSLDKPGEVVKEYELGVGVLGKPEGFDPRLDSAVRVHTARLRAKLAEYYMAGGASDSILIEVPKGSYHIAWHYRNGETSGTDAAKVSHDRPQAAGRKWFLAGFGVAALLACASAAVWSSVHAVKEPALVEAFWNPFLRSPQPPLIVFSNHRFAGSSATGLHYFREGIDDPADRNDTYSGTGTVMAVAELDNVFALSGRAPRLKRAELLTWDEARDANIIFVGAPEANSRLRELAPLQHFSFKSSHEEPQFGNGGIVNLQPGPGEPQIYFGPIRPFTSDYAVIALLPNIHPERKVLILAGTNTYGGQAAAEFLMRSDSLSDLYSRLGVSKTARLPDFEALLQVTVNGGVPFGARILSAKLHKSARP